MGQLDRSGAARRTPAARLERPLVELPSELDCLRDVLPADTLEAAAARATAMGVGADRVLIAHGIIDEAAYLQRLSACTGIAIESLTTLDHNSCALRASELHFAAQNSVLPLRIEGELVYAIAPRGHTAATLMRLAENDAASVGRIRLIGSAQLQEFLLYKGGALARRAVDHLHKMRPDLSAQPNQAISIRLVLAFLALGALAVVAWILPQLTGDVLAIWFLACVALRATAALMKATPPVVTRIPDNELPVYSIVVALYREASSVAPLLASLEALDFPREKLDVIFAVEPNDLQTRAAIARLRPGPHVRVVVAPALGPQTKPKALNAALPFARGSFVVVYDAEDRPEPDQLRTALNAFRIGGDDLACAQASLSIHNTAESRFARLFGAEYAGQFDVVLPGLARLGLPLPLGGSSNHFRTASLRQVGAWDAFNVTEDADLGLRLARFGLRSTTIASTTWEEAPVSYRAWRNQRARWFKGWMQTCLVHVVHPLRLTREAGSRGLMTLWLLLGGSLVAALSLPVLGLMLAYGIFDLVIGEGAWLAAMLQPLHVVSFCAALIASIAIPLYGLARRGRLREATVLLWIVPYWACLSLAAWRALRLLIFAPTHWDKTEHGVSRSRTKPPARFSKQLPQARRVLQASHVSRKRSTGAE